MQVGKVCFWHSSAEFNKSRIAAFFSINSPKGRISINMNWHNVGF